MKSALCEVCARGTHRAIRKWVNKTWVGLHGRASWEKIAPLCRAGPFPKIKGKSPLHRSKGPAVLPWRMCVPKGGGVSMLCLWVLLKVSNTGPVTFTQWRLSSSKREALKPWSPVQIGRAWFKRAGFGKKAVVATVLINARHPQRPSFTYEWN